MPEESKTKFEIRNEELIAEISADVKEFPKYSTQIMNLANQNSQGTRSKVVGQLSELIQKCPHRKYKDWKKWYLEQQPTAINNATDKVFEMIKKLKKSMDKIDKWMVRRWVEDLVIDKTFIGIRFQEAILKRVATIKKTEYTMSNPEQESKGIDDFIGKTPVSIKPITYKTKDMLNEQIDAKIIFYGKKGDGIYVDISNLE